MDGDWDMGWRGWGLPARGELPYAPQLALKSFCHPEEGGRTHYDALCPLWLVRPQALRGGQGL